MLKKVIVLLLIFSLVFGLASCSGFFQPETFPEIFFDESIEESFAENYEIVDYNLKYFSASPFDYRLSPSEKYGVPGGGFLCLSALDDTDVNMFIATSLILYGNRRLESQIYVCKHIDSPIPMEDWTIKTATLFFSDATLEQALRQKTYFFECFNNEKNKHIQSGTIDKLNDVAQNYMNYYMEYNRTVKEYSASESNSFLEGIKTAYINGLNDVKISDTRMHLLGSGGYIGKYYTLLISFEENSNIVWHTYLYELNGQMYMKCSPYGEEEYYVKINEDFSNELISVIEEDSEFDIPDSTTAEETTEDPYQPTTEDPDGSIDWPYDD